jgi:hypothetical protein
MSNQKRNVIFLLSTAVLTMAACSFAYGQQPSPSPADEKQDNKTGTISGRVVNEGGQPLPNAAVFVRGVSSGQGRNTSTAADGSFQVSGLDPAVYSITASVPAYVMPSADPDALPVYYRIGDSARIDLIKGGVITGTVTSASGEPVVSVRVRVFMIRDANGQPPKYGVLPSNERPTDDRGIYRIYGLRPGTYIVSAGGPGPVFGMSSINPYEGDTPTYAPSAVRANAAEIIVRSGDEASGVDIRYRGEPGHVISGTVSGPNNGSFSVSLSLISNGVRQSVSSSYQQAGSRGFALLGIADGDYELVAQAGLAGGDSAASEVRRVKIKGADVSGIELVTKPLGSIAGQIALIKSAAPECTGKRRPLFSETLVFIQRNEKKAANDDAGFFRFGPGSAPPDKAGAFVIRNLTPGEYNFDVRFFAKYWYLQLISLPAAPAAGRGPMAGQQIDAARNWTNVKLGDRVTGLKLTLAEGAASFHGNVKPPEGQKVPAKLYVHLVPAEKDKADDVLRFFASRVNNDGTFALGNLPPGRYWALTRIPTENESQLASKLHLPDEADARAKLRREAEAAKTEVEFKPCQNITDYTVSLKP